MKGGKHDPMTCHSSQAPQVSCSSPHTHRYAGSIHIIHILQQDADEQAVLTPHVLATVMVMTGSCSKNIIRASSVSRTSNPLI